MNLKVATDKFSKRTNLGTIINMLEKYKDNRKITILDYEINTFPNKDSGWLFDYLRGSNYGHESCILVLVYCPDSTTQE